MSNLTLQFRKMGAAIGILAIVTAVAACGSSNESNGGDSNGLVTVYTGRHYGIESVFEQFTSETGIQVRFTTGGDPELRARLEAEGANTPADVLMTADAANISLAAEAGLLSTVDSKVLTEPISSLTPCNSCLSASV